MSNSHSEGSVRNRGLPALTGLRAIAAGWVVVVHFQFLVSDVTPISGPIDRLMQAGVLGVDIFFVLSGFIIAYNYADRLATPNLAQVRSFLWLRFARIWPVHVATIVLACLLVAAAAVLHRQIEWTSSITVPNVLANVLMLQVLPFVQAINVPSWSISVEFAAYIVFPLLALVLPVLAVRARSIVVTIVLGAIGTAALVFVFGAMQVQSAGFPGGFLRILVEFPLGALLAVLWRTIGREVPAASWISWGSLAALVVVAATTPEGYEFLALPLIALLVLSLASPVNTLGTVLSTRVFTWGGLISYSVYMTHWFVLRLVHNLIPDARMTSEPLPLQVAILVGVVALVIAGGAVCYRFVEEPSRLLLRRLVTRRPIVEETQLARAADRSVV